MFRLLAVGFGFGLWFRFVTLHVFACLVVVAGG